MTSRIAFEESLEALEEKLGYSFRTRDNIITAMTHSSFAKESRDQEKVEYNERLEFLGDAFFDAIVGEEFYRRFPDKEEGFLSKMRAMVVCENSLADKAEQLKLGDHLRLSRGEDKTGGRHRTSILADAMEAVIGAVYLDSDFETTRDFVLRLFREEIEDSAFGRNRNTDYKTELQEQLQARGITDIRYEVIDETGPDHDKTFTVRLFINGRSQTEGTGKSKKEAQQDAARIKLERETDNAL